MGDFEREQGRYKAWSDWIDETIRTGGVEECSDDAADAMRAAYNYCLATHLKNGWSDNLMARTGFKWVSAFMVSCAKHQEGKLFSIFSQAQDRQEAFNIEAARNVGEIASILSEAGNADPRLFHSVMAATNATLKFGPTGDGQSWREIKE